jgi:hypothetical protein
MKNAKEQNNPSVPSFELCKQLNEQMRDYYVNNNADKPDFLERTDYCYCNNGRLCINNANGVKYCLQTGKEIAGLDGDFTPAPSLCDIARYIPKQMRKGGLVLDLFQEYNAIKATHTIGYTVSSGLFDLSHIRLFEVTAFEVTDIAKAEAKLYAELFLRLMQSDVYLMPRQSDTGSCRSFANPK